MSFAIRGRIGSFYGVTGSMLGAPYGSLGGPGGVSWAARGRVLCYLGTHRVVLWGHLLHVGGCLGQLGRSGGGCPGLPGAVPFPIWGRIGPFYGVSCSMLGAASGSLGGPGGRLACLDLFAPALHEPQAS